VRKIYLLISMMLMMVAMSALSETKETASEAEATSVSIVAPASLVAPVSTTTATDPAPVQNIPPLATEATPLPTKADRHAEGANSDDVKQLVMGLISVLVLIFVLYFLVRKIPGIKVLGNPHMKVISVMNVGVKEKIALIQVGERVFLLGITAHNISYLHEFVSADVLFSQTQSADVNATFQNMMQKIFERRPS
jgi:flagellar protein FliO/FliZ